LLLTRIIHVDFYCNRRYTAATSLTADGLAAQSVNILLGAGSGKACPLGSARPSRVASQRCFVTNCWIMRARTKCRCCVRF